MDPIVTQPASDPPSYAINTTQVKALESQVQELQQFLINLKSKLDTPEDPIQSDGTAVATAQLDGKDHKNGEVQAQEKSHGKVQ